MLLAALVLSLNGKNRVKETPNQPLAESNQTADQTNNQPSVNSNGDINQSTANINQATETPPMVGNDRDEHGCIGSAGYSWCEASQKCLRPWEEYCGTQATTTSQVIVDHPVSGSIITSPLVVTGQAVGNWFFEASLPVKILDADNKIIASTPGQAQADWMTTNMVPFRAELTFKTPTSADGYLVIAKDNPSGLPKNDASVKIPVKFR